MVYRLTALRFRGEDYPLGLFETDAVRVGAIVEDKQGRTWVIRAAHVEETVFVVDAVEEAPGWGRMVRELDAAWRVERRRDRP